MQNFFTIVFNLEYKNLINKINKLFRFIVVNILLECVDSLEEMNDVEE